MDRFDFKTRSRIMRSIRSKDTRPELMVQEVLPVGFEKHHKDTYNSDFVYLRERVAIFVDGDFWHGKGFNEKMGGYTTHWRRHIKGNIERDKRQRGRLREDGWLVLEFWESEVYKDVRGIGLIVERCLKERRETVRNDYQRKLIKR